MDKSDTTLQSSRPHGTGRRWGFLLFLALLATLATWLCWTNLLESQEHADSKNHGEPAAGSQADRGSFAEAESATPNIRGNPPDVRKRIVTGADDAFLVIEVMDGTGTLVDPHSYRAHVVAISHGSPGNSKAPVRKAPASNIPVSNTSAGKRAGPMPADTLHDVTVEGRWFRKKLVALLNRGENHRTIVVEGTQPRRVRVTITHQGSPVANALVRTSSTAVSQRTASDGTCYLEMDLLQMDQILQVEAETNLGGVFRVFPGSFMPGRTLSFEVGELATLSIETDPPLHQRSLRVGIAGGWPIPVKPSSAKDGEPTGFHDLLPGAYFVSVADTNGFYIHRASAGTLGRKGRIHIGLRAGEHAALKVSLSKGASLTGTAGCDGKPSAGARVHLRRLRKSAGQTVHGVPIRHVPSNRDHVVSVTADTNGRFQFSGLHPGRYAISATSDDTFFAEHPVDVSDSQRLQRVSLEGIRGVRVVIRGFSGYLRIRNHAARFDEATLHLASTPKATLVPSGVLDLETWRRPTWQVVSTVDTTGRRWVPVELRGIREFTIELLPGSTATGRRALVRARHAVPHPAVTTYGSAVILKTDRPNLSLHVAMVENGVTSVFWIPLQPAAPHVLRGILPTITGGLVVGRPTKECRDIVRLRLSMPRPRTRRRQSASRTPYSNTAVSIDELTRDRRLFLVPGQYTGSLTVNGVVLEERPIRVDAGRMGRVDVARGKGGTYGLIVR